MAALRWGGYGAAALFLWLVASSLGLIAILELWDALGRVPAWSIPLQWPLYAWHYGSYHGVPEALLASGGAATALAGVCLASGVRSAGKKPLHGESHFATRREAERRGIAFTRRPDPFAIVLGKVGWGPFALYACLPGQQHAAVYAPTEAGKDVSIAAPNALNWGGSLIAFLVKRDMVRYAAAERARKGDAVFVLDITAPGGMTHRWNPLGMVRRGTPDAADDIQKAMFGLVPETKSANPYWDNAGRRVVTALAVLQSETPGAPLNVPAVAALIRRPDAVPHLRGMVERARGEGRPYPRAAAETVLGWCDGMQKESEEARGVRQTVLTALALWEIPRVQAATAESDFDLRRLRSERLSVFVCAQPDDIRRFRPIYANFFRQLIYAMAKEEYGETPDHAHPVLGIMNEFWALGEIKELADAVAFIRSSGLRILYIMQSKNQTVMSFGQHGSDNLFANVGVEVLFGGVDQKLAEEVSKRGGTDTVAATSKSRPRFGGWLFPAKQSETEAEKPRNLLLPQEVQLLPDDELLALRPKLWPLKLKRIFWFKDPWFRGMAGDPPPISPLAVEVEREDAEAIRQEQRTADAAAEAAAALDAARAQARREDAERKVAEAEALARHALEAWMKAEKTAGEAVRAAAAANEALRLAKRRAPDEAHTDEAEAAAAAAERARTVKQRATVAARDAKKTRDRANALCRAFEKEYPRDGETLS